MQLRIPRRQKLGTSKFSLFILPEFIARYFAANGFFEKFPIAPSAAIRAVLILSTAAAFISEALRLLTMAMGPSRAQQYPGHLYMDMAKYGYGECTGGIAGQMDGGNVSGCTVTETQIRGTKYSGGIVGNDNYSVFTPVYLISNCVSEDSVTVKVKRSNSTYAGPIVGTTIQIHYRPGLTTVPATPS
ncbi:MAG: hypothetical protein ACOX47_10985 [Bacillota bacterium]